MVLKIGGTTNTHAMLIDDEELQVAMDKRIEQQLVCAESALQDELMSMVAEHQVLADDYLCVRELDIRDILNRTLGHLTGLPPVALSVDREILLLAEELFPSQMIGLNRGQIKGICLSKGHIFSHSAILATELDIPMLVGAVVVLTPAAMVKMLYWIPQLEHSNSSKRHKSLIYRIP